MELPAISVVLTLYNRPQFMAEAIDSVLSQTLHDFELLLIDDGSTESRVAEIAREYESKDARVRYFIKKNGGPASARNFGVEQSRAEIIAFCDDDDISEPHRLQTQLDYLQSHADIAAVTTCFTNIDAIGKPLRKQPQSQTDAVVSLWVSGGVACIRRTAFLAVGGYRQWFLANEDIDFSLRFTEKFITMQLPQRLLCYRKHGDGRLSYSINSWRYDFAARYAAWCRSLGKPDPITTAATWQTVLKEAANSDWEFRLEALQEARNIAKYLMRSGDYAAAVQLLYAATCRFDNDAVGARYSKKMGRDMLRWAVLYGKFGFILAFVKHKTSRA